MKRLLLSLLLCLSTAVASRAQTEARTQILVETSKGKFIIELFNETPKHRDNFIAKVRAGQYDGTLFHRVIKEFMVQGGNLLSNKLKKGEILEDDSTAGTLPAEIEPRLYIHERGALAAARTSDDVNPERASSASQFYIVTGKYYTELDLNKEQARNGVTYTPAQKEAYMLRGGAAHLDGAYTVFGRLLDGWGTIDKIQRVETDDDDRPTKDVYIKRASIYIPKK